MYPAADEALDYGIGPDRAVMRAGHIADTYDSVGAHTELSRTASRMSLRAVQ
jgi:hypothetical protein